MMIKLNFKVENQGKRSPFDLPQYDDLTFKLSGLSFYKTRLCRIAHCRGKLHSLFGSRYFKTENNSDPLQQGVTNLRPQGQIWIQLPPNSAPEPARRRFFYILCKCCTLSISLLPQQPTSNLSAINRALHCQHLTSASVMYLDFGQARTCRGALPPK